MRTLSRAISMIAMLLAASAWAQSPSTTDTDHAVPLPPVEVVPAPDPLLHSDRALGKVTGKLPELDTQLPRQTNFMDRFLAYWRAHSDLNKASPFEKNLVMRVNDPDAQRRDPGENYLWAQ